MTGDDIYMGIFEEDDHDYRDFCIKHKLSTGQTMMMSFQETYNENHTIHWNVFLELYSKRKHADHNIEAKLLTGKSPLESFAVARRMFLLLQEYIVNGTDPDCDKIIFCQWVDNRRREAYFQVLRRYGYEYGTLFGEKVIFRRFGKDERIDADGKTQRDSSAVPGFSA